MGDAAGAVVASIVRNAIIATLRDVGAHHRVGVGVLVIQIMVQNNGARANL